jgi:hypothetical protein
MPNHEYTPEKALELLMRKLGETNEILAAQIQAAIDAGKDIRETEPSPDGRKKPRVYRKTVPFTYEEALQVALDGLQAHFVEQPLFMKSAALNFTRTAIGRTGRRVRPGSERPRLNSAKQRETISMEQLDEEKVVEIELQTETQIEKSGPETEPLKRLDDDQIKKRQSQLSKLRKLTTFQPE